jgi:hypothetical protein
MSHVSSIALRNCRIYANWKEAPNGMLVQLIEQLSDTATSEPIVGMKGQMELREGQLLEIFFVLSQANIGEWKSMNDMPAVDVSSGLEIYIDDPTPRPISSAELPGAVYVHKNGSVFMWVFNREVEGFACIRGSDEFLTGMFYHEVDYYQLFEVGRATLKPTERISIG